MGNQSWFLNLSYTTICSFLVWSLKVSFPEKLHFIDFIVNVPVPLCGIAISLTLLISFLLHGDLPTYVTDLKKGKEARTLLNLA